MEKHPKQTTMNGAEIKNPGEVLSAEGLKNLVAEAGIDGSTPKERWENNYGIVSESRDIARERGGFIINGYIPYLPEGKSRSNPEDVIAYLESLLSSEHKDDRLYTGPFGQAPLYK